MFNTPPALQKYHLLVGLCLGLFAAGLLTAPVAAGGAQPTPLPTAVRTADPATRVASADAAGSPTAAAYRLDLDRLLADPVSGRPDFEWLRARRDWLARRGEKPEDFDKVAAELEKRGAFYPALEVLWFAEKFAQPPEGAKARGERMKKLQAAAAAQ